MPNLVVRLLSAISLFLSIDCLAVEAPKSLEEWIPWVLEKHPEVKCPVLFNSNDRACSWYSSLKIEATDKGATFVQDVVVYKDDWISLPGGHEAWPHSIKINQTALATRDQNGQAEVFLTSGSHQITGSLSWADKPRTLKIPSQLGLIQLSLNGKPVINPLMEGDTQLRLANNQQDNAMPLQDSLNVRVFRKIEDNIPLKLTTKLLLSVSGKEREIELGQMQLDDFTTIDFESDLPALIEKNGNLRVQVKSGTWEITLISHRMTNTTPLSYATRNTLWPHEEIWVFESQRQLRSVQISGAQSIDPQQTQLPEDWKTFPAYLVTPQNKLTLQELSRGKRLDIANELRLDRDAWLGFSGKDLILSDSLQGKFHSSRIESLHPMELTSARINGAPQVITQLEKNGNSGLEIRSEDLMMQAVSKIPREFSVPIVGWDQDINAVTTRLHLPPGWSVFTATGTSYESGTWISGWTLWDMFAVLIIAVAFARLISLPLGIIAGLGLALIYQREGAPIFILLNLLVVISLLSLVSGKIKSWLKGYAYLSFLTLAIICLPFMVREARILINPSIENQDFWLVDSSSLMLGSQNYSVHKKSIPAPASAPVAAPEKMSEVEEVVVTELRQKADIDAVSAEDMGQFPNTSSAEALQRIGGISPQRKLSTQYDPSLQTQTGEAVPSFNHKVVQLNWEGPIKMNETTKLFLLPPLLNKLGHLLSIVFVSLISFALIFKFLQVINSDFPTGITPRKNSTKVASAIILAFACLMGAQSTQANITIDPSILKELEARLTEPPKCLPNCAAIERAHIATANNQLQLEVIVNSSELIALPIPSSQALWKPTQVKIDGKIATLVESATHGLLVSLPKGQHKLEILANLQGQNSLNLKFPLPLHNLTSSVSGWALTGSPTALQTSQSLQLERVERDSSLGKEERLLPEPIATFVSVTRIIHIDLEWTIETIVRRVAPATGAINLEIPLLEGEAPLSTKVNEAGKIAVHMEHDEDEYSWTSNLKDASTFELSATQNVPWIEIWSIDIGARWHMKTTGIAAIQLNEGDNIPVWQPWPGEKLSVDISRPVAVKGKHLTIDNAHLKVSPGSTSSINELSLSVRTNQGGQYTFQIPKDGELSKLTIDNQEQLLSSTNGVLKIPLRPGTQHLSITWKEPKGVNLFTKTPSFSLENGSSNQHINVEMPENRWILWMGGPQIGPSVLLWGVLLVMSIIAYGLSRTQLTQLKSYEWILLSLGICTLSMWTFILVAAWLLTLGLRGKLTAIHKPWHFKFMQIALFTLSAWALITLAITLPDGLLSSPDMRIIGENTYNTTLYWYQDQSPAQFPRAWIISLPLWCYKVTILVWSLWFAIALINWLRWGWKQLSYRGLWDAEEILLSGKNS